MCIYKYFSHWFYTKLQKQAIFFNQFGYWVTFYGGFWQNLTSFEKSDLVLFARAENQHNKKLKRRKEKKLSKYRDFSKNLEKKHVYQQIRRVGFSIVNSKPNLVNSPFLQVNFCKVLTFVISVIKWHAIVFLCHRFEQKTNEFF